MNILSIETSCDETAVAVIKDGTEILSSVVASSANFHEQFGGILPELASRKQLEFMIPTLFSALSQAFPESFKSGKNINLIDNLINNLTAIAVTTGPGLIGSLLVGVETAKTVSYLTQLPLIPVNHVLAHIYANMLNTNSTIEARAIKFPAVALVASGGHTELFHLSSLKNLTWISGTIDDAAGEAFDKTARLLGFQNQGGRAIESAAIKHQKDKSTPVLPRPLMRDATLNFSFSGLKTAVANSWKKQGGNINDSKLVASYAYEIQEAITDVLVEKTVRAAGEYSAKTILVSGGVAANSRLQEKFRLQLKNSGIEFYSPSSELCTDNAAAIGAYAFYHQNPVSWEKLTAIPNLSVEKL